jgi:hypothetical protein
MKFRRERAEPAQPVVEVHVRRRPTRGLRVRVLGPVMLTLALGTGYVILLHAVPALGAVRERQPGAEGPGWATAIWRLSELVESHQSQAIPAILITGGVALFVGFVSRGLATLIYLLAFLLVILDILIMVGAVATVWGELLGDAGAL